jgi:transposase
METWETLTMSRKEVPRAGLIKAALAGRISTAQGATGLRVSVRQFQRLKDRFRAEGAPGLLHKGRGQPSARRLPPEIQERIGELLRTTYAGFNDCHFCEKLGELEDARLHVSRASVRRIRRALGLPPKRRRRPRQGRHRRQPEAAMGTLIQVDASPFAWLEDRGPALTLVGAIDDATGAIVGLTFRPTEDLHGYAEVFQQVFVDYGLPVSVYGDGTNILLRNDAHWTIDEELQGVQSPTHLGCVLRDLGIGYIHARSPQAKGRIERLWATLQDRLVSELRLRGIATLEAANAYLPEFIAAYNARFARPPQSATAVWRRPPPDLDWILSCRYDRLVARDHSVRVGGRTILIPRQPNGRSWAGYRVDVRELLDGDLVVLYHGMPLAIQSWPGPFTLRPRSAPRLSRRPAPPTVTVVPAAQLRRPATPTSPPAVPAPPRQPRRPAPNHPWRRSASRRPARAALQSE